MINYNNIKDSDTLLDYLAFSALPIGAIIARTVNNQLLASLHIIGYEHFMIKVSQHHIIDICAKENKSGLYVSIKSGKDIFPNGTRFLGERFKKMNHRKWITARNAIYIYREIREGRVLLDFHIAYMNCEHFCRKCMNGYLHIPRELKMNFVDAVPFLNKVLKKVGEIK